MMLRQRSSALLLLKAYWRSALVVLTPLVLLPLPIASPYASTRCAYVILIMAVYWMLDLVPLAVTSLLPMALFPMLGVLSSEATSMCYLKGGCVLFIGGSVLATAVEQSNLHRRIALNAMLMVGTSPRFLMLGFILPTAFLSMWISNTAATALMLPMFEAIVIELCSDELPKTDAGASEPSPSSPRPVSAMSVRERHLRATLAMSICYAANVGGTVTTIGTPPNLFLVGLMNAEYGNDHPLNFSTWIGFSLPQAIICLFFVWIWLQIYFLGLPSFGKKKSGAAAEDNHGANVKALLTKRRDELGPWTFAEGAVLAIFITLVLVWFFRSPGFMPGWGDVLEEYYKDLISIDDATPAILFAVVLFLFPARPSFFRLLSSPKRMLKRVDETSPIAVSPPLVEWSFFEARMAWGVVMLMGSGYALAEASEETGLSAWMGEQLEGLGSLDAWQISLVVSVMAGVLTQIASNIATSSMLIPVLNALSSALCMNPLYVMLPPTLVCSYAFMLPASTGPNAIAFGPSALTTFEMIKMGSVMTLLCVAAVAIATNTYGVPMFDLNTMPEWANFTGCATARL